MAKSNPYLKSIDPEYRRWGREYPRFPGVDECLRLIRSGKARGARIDIIVHELAAHAATSLDELIAAYRRDDCRVHVLMALDLARLPQSVPFLAEVLRHGDPRCAVHAEHALNEIGTRDARVVLFETRHRREDA